MATLRASEVKEYAVVIFEDNTCSEIPTSWLIKGHKRCLWPTNVKNASNLMAKCIEPDESWVEYNIEIEAYCTSLSTARKKAEYKDYTTSDESDFGRGKRPKAKFQPYSSSNCSSDSRESSYSPTPPPPPQLRSTHSLIKTLTCKAPQSEKSVELVTDQQGNSAVDCSDNINLTNVDINDLPIVTINSDTSNVPPSFIPFDISMSNNADLDKKIETMSEMLHGIHLYVKSIDERLKAMQNSKVDENATTAEIKLFNEILPIPDLEALKELEVLLEEEVYMKNFYTFLNNIGGKNLKENMHRLLKRVFSNKMAVKCSWLGQRGNFRVGNLKSMKIIKDVIISSYVDAKENTCETIASEWFRLAKLRLEREK